ncbi:metal-dependent phosphohydrolase [Desulfobacter hydrogenophilus]|uniref:HD domain-containing protein n=1 Tax=Desulfobacter hydrogenophilus TaxID=2291 RepID=A0A328FK22_9BACT|nr:NTP transferase domain-containing protein [Desulfobacter hydrogenophilus]NDY70697.1 NTP transferase domain-containing protein [Desulfobacter hydrogenophilus]QBH12687.1 HD domain-containing protein [Desulfobacter hydrogenophilus]RAM03347.1 metal-dependent phosphohydrolase [Desulfobacter hydrogenophilus]
MTAALIPAAGLSSRMGRYKPLLPLGRTTMIGSVIALFKTAGIREIIVVTGHNHDRLAPAVEAAGARPLFNPDYASGMFSSIRTGVADLPSGITGFFLLPADTPAIRPATIGLIRRKFEEDKDALIVPAFKGETGHPPLIPARLIPAITGAHPDTNLRQILFSDPSHIIQLPVHDRGILMDADTPDDYGRVKQKYEKLEIPDETECRSIIDRELADAPAIRAHLDRVCDTALTLARDLRPWGFDLDINLIRAGALLHDIKRKKAHHAEAGSRFLQRLGFPKAADIVAAHMDLTPGPELDETQIVFLADKLCRGDRLDLDYPGRFHEKASRLPHAKKEIYKRLETAQHIHARIESAAGRSLGEILG